MQVCLYLFNDILLLTESKTNCKQHYLVDPIPLDDVVIVREPTVDEGLIRKQGKHVAWFEVYWISRDESYVLQTANKQHRHYWVDALQGEAAKNGRWRRRRGGVTDNNQFKGHGSHYLSGSPVQTTGTENPIPTPKFVSPVTEAEDGLGRRHVAAIEFPSLDEGESETDAQPPSNTSLDHNHSVVSDKSDGSNNSMLRCVLAAAARVEVSGHSTTTQL